MAARVVAITLAMIPAFRAVDLIASESEAMKANPIRKVVTMLETMQKKVEAEGKHDEALFQKFQCYCTTNKGELTAAIAAAEAKGVQVSADIEAGENEKAQLDAELKAHRSDRDAAKSSVAQASAIREKE